MSALLRWWFKVPYSHVYIRWPTPWNYDEILEASGTSVKMVNHTIWDKKNKTLFEYNFNISRSQFTSVMTDIRPLTGRLYGWIQLVGIAWHELFGSRYNPFSDGDVTIVCSEVALKLLVILGYDIGDLDPDLVNPKDIKEILDKRK